MLAQMQRLLTTPGMIARTCNAVRAEDTAIGGREVLGLLTDAGGLWIELTPAERALNMRLLVERVAFSDDLVRIAMASLVRSDWRPTPSPAPTSSCNRPGSTIPAA